MAYVILESIIYVSWAYVFLSRMRREGRAASEELHVLVLALPTTIIMELRAEYLQSGTGTFYPSSLSYFPGFKFPVAIVLAGSLFTWALYTLSRGISTRVAGESGWRFNLTHLVLFLLLLWSSRLVEAMAVSIGYWQWHITPAPRAMWIGGYLYYFRLAVPAALAARFLSWHGQRTAGQAKLPEGTSVGG